MSDDGRKSFHTKVFERITPGIFKGKQEKAKETATDTVDTVAGEAQPDSTKGPLQEASDKMGRVKDRSNPDNEPPLRTHKHIFGRKKTKA